MTDFTSSDLVSVIAASRKQAGLSQRDLAQLTGLTQGQISAIETGDANSTLRVIDVLMQRLGLRLMPIPEGRMADILAILAEEGLLPDHTMPTALDRFGHLLDEVDRDQ